MTTSTHGTSQSLYSSNESDCELHSFYSMEGLMDKLRASETVFSALSYAKEINELNGYKVITDYQIKQLKEHFKQKNEWSTNLHKVVDSNPHIVRRDKGRELQKGYMSLLSN